MIGLNIVVIGAKAIAARWLKKSVVLPVETYGVREKNAQTLLALIKSNASGRPGPEVITGSYRASWHIERQAEAHVVTTGAPQAMRLEYGFVGEDALGRDYSQPPFPHVNPAADVIEQVYVDDMLRVVVDGL